MTKNSIQFNSISVFNSSINYSRALRVDDDPRAPRPRVCTRT